MRTIALVLYAFWTLTAKDAHADSGSIGIDDITESARRVTLVVAGDGDTGTTLESRLGELAHRLDVSLTAKRVSAIDPHEIIFGPSDGAMARVWIDASREDVAVVYLSDRTGGRVLLRRVDLAGGVDEVAREQIGQIVRASVEALLSGATIGLTRDEAADALGLPQPAPPPTEAPALSAEATPASSGAARARLTLGAGYAASLLTAHQIASGPVVTLSLARAAEPWSFGGTLAFDYRLPRTVAQEPLELRVQGGSLHVLAFANRSLSDRFALGLALGGGLDGAYAAPKGATDARGVTVFADDASVTPALRAEASLELSLSPRTRAALAFTADWDLAPRDYVVRHEGGTSLLAQPLALRPGLALRIAGDLVR